MAARVAYLAAGMNLLAGASMAILLRPGLPVMNASIESRAAYLAAHHGRWVLGWIVWHGAALSLLAFYVALGTLWFARAPLRCALGALACVGGLAVDFGAEAIYMGVLPRLSGTTFGLAEDAMGLLTGYVGNGLYTLGGLFVVWAGAREMPTRLVALSAPVWLGGFGLSVASLAQSGPGQMAASAVLFPAFVVWALLVGRWLGRPSTSPAPR